MRKLLCLALCMLLMTPGCDQVNKLTQFNMEYNNTVVVPSSSGINLPFNLLTPDIETNSESTFAVNDTRKELIEEIRLTLLQLSIQSPANEDFSFLESISIYITAEGMQELKVAWKDNIPDNSSSVFFVDARLIGKD